MFNIFLFLFCVRGESRRKIKRLTKCLAFLTLLLTPPESLMGKQSNEARFMRRVSDGGPRPNKNFQFCLFCFEIPRLTGAFRFLHRFETQFTLCTSPAFRSSAVLTPSISQRPSLTRVYRGLIIVIVAGEEPSYHTPSASVWILRFFSPTARLDVITLGKFSLFSWRPETSAAEHLSNHLRRSIGWLFNSPPKALAVLLYRNATETEIFCWYDDSN